MEKKMFSGSMVALVTPLHNDAIDVPRLRALVEFHIAAGTKGLIAAGTTGESGTLTLDEKLSVIKIVIEQAKERVPVIAGTSANSTQACIELTYKAMECGADAALIMTPSYIRPTQEGLYQHYSKIAKTVPIPIILYNVPSRTGCDLLPATVKKLAKISNIIGIKEAIPDIQRLQELLSIQENAIDVYSGDDHSAAAWLLGGAKGVISVTANVVPRQMAKLCDTALYGDGETCLLINESIEPLHHLLFVESNPIPVKWALSKMNLIENELRLPLTSLSREHQASIEAVLKQLELIS